MNTWVHHAPGQNALISRAPLVVLIMIMQVADHAADRTRIAARTVASGLAAAGARGLHAFRARAGDRTAPMVPHPAGGGWGR